MTTEAWNSGSVSFDPFIAKNHSANVWRGAFRFSVFFAFFIGIAAYRIALEESQEVIDRQMQEMAEFLDKNDLSLRLSTYDPKAEYDETDVFIDIIKDTELAKLSQQYDYILPYSSTPYFTRKKPSAANLKFMCILPKTSKFRLVS